MKKILALLTAALTLGVVAPTTAEAGPRHDHGSSMRASHRCDDCGAVIYRVRYIAFYHRDGCPEYRWRTVRHFCRPSHGGHGHGDGGHGHGHGGGGHSHGGGGHRR